MAAHLPALAELSAAGLVQPTACDSDPVRAEAAGRQFDIPWVTDWEEAAEGVDAVSVCLAPGPNAAVAAAAAGRGLHVMCEKPPGRDRAQAAAMARAASEHPEAVTMIGFNRRYNPLYRRAMRRSLELGQPTVFFARFTQPAIGSPPDDGVDNWILSSGSHAIDLAVATIGYPDSVSVGRSRLGPGPDNSWAIELHGPRGASLLMLHFAAGRRTERFEWAGPGYDVVLTLPKQAEWAQSGSAVETWGVDVEGFHNVGGFTEEYRAFLGAIAGTSPAPEADFAYAPRYHALVDTILGARTGSHHPVICETEAHEAEPARPGPLAAETLPLVRNRPGRPVVVIHQPASVHPRLFAASDLAELRQACDLRVARPGASPAEVLADADALVTGRGVKVVLTPEMVEAAPRLALVVVMGASLQNFAAPTLLERGVVVCNTADALAMIVAEHCLMVTLAGLRRLTATDRAMHEGGWPRPGQGARKGLDIRRRAKELPLPPAIRSNLAALDRRLAAVRGSAVGGGSTGLPALASDLRGEVVGLIGWGHTARRFAELLAPFGCTILVASDHAADADLEMVGAQRSSTGELLAVSRVVSLHKGLTDSTAGYLGESHLTQLRPGTVLVNTARGGLIDEGALVARLRRGDIVAALDVYAEEPLPAKHPLRDLPNVILTPHHASSTAQEERRMGDQALAVVSAWLQGSPVESIDSRRLGNMT